MYISALKYLDHQKWRESIICPLCDGFSSRHHSQRSPNDMISAQSPPTPQSQRTEPHRHTPRAVPCNPFPSTIMPEWEEKLRMLRAIRRHIRWQTFARDVPNTFRSESSQKALRVPDVAMRYKNGQQHTSELKKVCSSLRTALVGFFTPGSLVHTCLACTDDFQQKPRSHSCYFQNL